MPEDIVITIDPRCVVNKPKFAYLEKNCPNGKSRSAINQYKTTHEAYKANDMRCGLCGFNRTYNGDVKTE